MPTSKTIGMVVVAALAASAGGSPPIAAHHGHLTRNQIGRQARKSIVLPLRPAVFNRDVLALDIARFVQALAEGSHTPTIRRP
jgi:hypothetical protein